MHVLILHSYDIDGILQWSVLPGAFEVNGEKPWKRFDGSTEEP
ncbi:hypothetical protein SLEP1_g28433 [Rubroshorea leprosula]|uniref:Uncharacterized protein n=1 Tax=Rubroshorea leprosula TaxID=152421 RepID=A0AAV5JTN2_9ROSI|nr:hypothetical protein SLEP1_g28433 [Rubroshorea leprosula]